MSDDGFPDHAVFKCYPDFKAMMYEGDEDSEDSEDEFSCTKCKDKDESFKTEEV